VLVLRAGDAIPEVAADGDFPLWIERAAAHVWAGKWLERDLRSFDPLPEANSISGVIITGSSSSVTERASWMLRAEAYVRDLVQAEIPLLGICFGHQLIGQALGGQVRKNPHGREIGTVEVSCLEDDPLFEGAPNRFCVNATHVDSLVELPVGAKVIARTTLEPNAVVAFGQAARGVQFHPEMDRRVIRGYIEAKRSALVEEGLNVDAIFGAASDPPFAAATVPNFVRHFVLSPAPTRRETAATTVSMLT